MSHSFMHPLQRHSHLLPVLPRAANTTQQDTSVLAWSAWQRVLAVLPVLALLWLAVGWACAQG